MGSRGAVTVGAANETHVTQIIIHWEAGFQAIILKEGTTAKGHTGKHAQRLLVDQSIID